MNRHKAIAAWYVLALAALFALSGCWASSWTNPVSSFPATMLAPSYNGVPGQILVLPFWRMYRDTKCETSFFFAPPVMLPADELPVLANHLRNYKHKATIYLFMHPTWRWSPDLLGVYLVYPDGRMIWAGGDDLTWPEESYPLQNNPWTEFQAARMGKRWQQTLVTGMRLGGLQLSELAADIGQPIQVYGLRMRKLSELGDPTCDHQASKVCCNHELVTFKSDSREQVSTAIRYLEGVPTGDASVEEWNPVQ